MRLGSGGGRSAGTSTVLLLLYDLLDPCGISRSLIVVCGLCMKEGSNMGNILVEERIYIFAAFAHFAKMTTPSLRS